MVKHWTLPNGLKVLVSPLKDTKSITILVLVRVGSRYESRSLNGVSHFVEHLVFKGTKKRPTTLDISRDLDRVGANYNAFTGKDHTGFYVKISSRYTELAMDVVSDILWNAQFPKDELDRERTVIHEEINMYEDNPLMHIQDLIENALYGKTSYLGQLISGPKSVIRNVSHKDILKFWNTYYQPGNMALSIAGDITDTSARKLVRAYFSGQGKKRQRASYPSDRPYPRGPRALFSHRKTGQVQLALGFRAFPYEHPLLPASQLLHVVLGASMSSRLFVEIREKLGLCYMIRSSLSVYEDQATFMIQSGLDRSRFSLALKRILEELRLIRMNGISVQELTDAKNYVKGKLDLAFEDSEEVASWYGAQEILLRKMESPEERVQRINAVTVEDVQKAAKEIFQPSRSAVSVIGDRRIADAATIRRAMREFL